MVLNNKITDIFIKIIPQNDLSYVWMIEGWDVSDKKYRVLASGHEVYYKQASEKAYKSLLILTRDEKIINT